MTSEEKVKYWIPISDYDLQTAKAMHESKRFVYVGFMCHQTIEKILKAYYEKIFHETPPYTHSLTYLSARTELEEELSDGQRSFIDTPEPLNIEARYPAYKMEIFKFMTLERSKAIISKTEEFQKWVKAKL